MNVTINGQARALDNAMTISDLIAHLQLADRKIAVEINRAIIPAGLHASTHLNEGDQVEIIEAVGGG